MLAAAILSDLHFGEPYNLVHDQGVPALLDLIKVHAQGHLRRLVLAGDIFEMSTPESMDAVRDQSRFFMRQARSRFQIGEVIWVPGNHDYTLFRKHFPSGAGTSWQGDPAPRALIDEYFGSDWQVPVRVAYPHLHLGERRGGKPTGRSWVVHHGHYLDDLLLGRSWNARASAWLSALAGGHAVRPAEVPLDRQISLAQLESTARPMLEGIWCHHPDPRNLQNEAWDLVRRFNDYLSCQRQEPDLIVPDRGEEAILGDLDLAKARLYLRAVRADPAYPRPASGQEILTLIFGHTHRGGTHSGSVDGVPLSLVNLGGWVASEGPTLRGKEAHTHIYLLNDDLGERLLTAPWPAEWARRCVDHGKTVFAIPGPDDEFVEQVMNAPPAPGIPVEQLLSWHGQHPFGQTRSNTDPFV